MREGAEYPPDISQEREMLRMAYEIADDLYGLPRQDVEDVAMQIVERVLRRGGVPHPTNPDIAYNPKGYMQVTARNLQIDRGRTAQRKPETLVDTTNFEEQIFFPPNRNDPQTICEETTLDPALVSSLNELSPSFRPMLLLKADGYSQEEIAEKMEGIPVGTVKSGLYRAAKAMAAKLRSPET